MPIPSEGMPRLRDLSIVEVLDFVGGVRLGVGLGVSAEQPSRLKFRRVSGFQFSRSSLFL